MFACGPADDRPGRLRDMTTNPRTTPYQRSRLLRGSTTALVVASVAGASATGVLAAALWAQDNSWGITSNPSGGSGGSVHGTGLGPASQGAPQGGSTGS